jgi:hypothetical protein
MTKLDSIDNLLEDIKKMRVATELLENLWAELGPYRTNKISEETWDKVRNFFNFDDGE